MQPNEGIHNQDAHSAARSLFNTEEHYHAMPGEDRKSNLEFVELAVAPSWLGQQTPYFDANQITHLNEGIHNQDVQSAARALFNTAEHYHAMLREDKWGVLEIPPARAHFLRLQLVISELTVTPSTTGTRSILKIVQC